MSSIAQSIRQRPLQWVVVIAVVAVGVVIAVATWASAKSSDSANGLALTYEVTQGPMTIGVGVAGSIKSRQQEVIKNEVEGQTTILSLTPEGTRVKKGDLLVELDSSKLQDQRIDKLIGVQNADAKYVQAKENLEVVNNQTRSDISKAELDYRFAQEDLTNYESGEYPKLKKEAQSKIQLAKAELKRAEDKLSASQKLAEQKYISATELQADDLSHQKSNNDLELAQGDLGLLENFTHKRKVDELKSNVDQTLLALERVKLKANSDVVQAQADFKAKELEFQQQKDQLAKFDRMIVKCKMYAPTDGLVVYATTGQGGGFRGNQEPLAEGQSVRERQDLIYLPTANSVMAEVKIHESALDKVVSGLPVQVKVDALPGKTYFGKVNRIAPLPDAQSTWQNPDLKVYNTEIYIDGDSEGLRTGMSCQAQIIVEQYDSVINVPVQAIVRVGGSPTAYVMKDGRLEPKKVEIGLDNNQMVLVKSGLTVGDKVLLNPPLEDAAVRPDQQFASAGKSEAIAAALLDARANATTRPSAAAAPAAGGPPPQGAAPGPQAGAPGGGQGGTFDWANATPEQRDQMRQRRRDQGGGAEGGAGARAGGAAGGGGMDWANATPEQREQMRQRRQQAGEQAGQQGAGAGGGGMDWANATPEQREQMRQRFQNMTPEEREQMRQRAMENMTPEQREQMRQRFQQGGGAGGPGGGQGGQQGGQ
jgi:HlyD family secretion protein